MRRNMKIEGMTCGHCQARVEKALNAIPGVKASVDLKAASASVVADDFVKDETLKKAVEDAGYSVVKIEEKKGLFGR